MMMEKKHPRIKILVACHRQDSNIRHDEVYEPIHVGKALHPDMDLGFIGDDTGDNISGKNESYCEVTAIYWAWKNLRDVDYIGLAHYRRYFDFSGSGIRDLVHAGEWNPGGEMKRLEKMLSPDTILAAREKILPYNVAIHYGRYHHTDDLKTVYQVIRERFPEYTEAFEKAILGHNGYSPYNMFVMPWALFDEYCSFLFPLLEEVEKRTDTSSYDPFQKRLIGFLAERLLNVFLARKRRSGIQIRRLPVVFIADPAAAPPLWLYLFNKWRYDLSFALSRQLAPSF